MRNKNWTKLFQEWIRKEKNDSKIYSGSDTTSPTSTLPNTQFGVPLSTKDYKEIYKAISNLYNESFDKLTHNLEFTKAHPKPSVYKANTKPLQGDFQGHLQPLQREFL